MTTSSTEVEATNDVNESVATPNPLNIPIPYTPEAVRNSAGNIGRRLQFEEDERGARIDEMLALGRNQAQPNV